MTQPIRVLIVDDHTIVRSGVRLLLEAEDDFRVVGEAVDGQESLAMVARLQPDVVIMDIVMPVLDGIGATREITAHWTDVKVVALTMHRDDDYLFQMLRAGAHGYVLKGGDTNDLIHAIRVVANGDMYLYPSMTRLLVDDYLRRCKSNGTNGNGPILSQREQEVLVLIAQGYRSNDIAEELVISPSTVNTHRGNIMSKLNLSTRPELVRYAHQHGFLEKFLEIRRAFT